MSSGHVLFLAVCLLLCSLQDLIAQEPIIQYDKNHLTARLLNCTEFANGKNCSQLNDQPFITESPEYPVTGNYSPTSYSNGPHGIAPNCGFSDYIFWPIEGQLIPGKQYTLKFTASVDETYDQMSFFQDNFGLALTSHLWPNCFPSYWGLWPQSKESIGILIGGELMTFEMDFRPLGISKYLAIGVFKGGNMDHLSCFFCKYPFEVHSLSITETNDPERAFTYFADEYKEAPPKLSEEEVIVYFESGSTEINATYAEILDSIPSIINSSQDLILLSAFTDKSGNDNDKLGAARNESVRQALVNRGIDNSKIIKVNHADTKAAEFVLSTDRKVEIDLGGGKVHKKLYMSALEAIEKGDYPTAHKIMLSEWIHGIPSERAIFALFDCWGESDKAQVFKAHLLAGIKNKYYRKSDLRFRLDSLNCEWLKGRTLGGHLHLNRMPGSRHECFSSTSNMRDSLLRKEVDSIFSKHGFPEKEKVGRRANEVLPKIILTSENTNYLEKYLPLVKTACENRKLEWRSYATLYDKISILKTGFQRYGTRMTRDMNNKPVPEFPFENESMVDEYRRQVKLAPFTRSIKKDIEERQDKLEPELVSILNNVYKADQHHRNRVDQQYRKFDRMKETDSINQVKVRKILNERGWLGPDIIGARGSTALFLVIQHADLETQLKYLPMMRDAVKKGDAKGRDLALLEDRVALGQGKKQIYGSQIYKDKKTGEHYVAPLVDPDRVNERRAQVGLMDIESYIRRWNINWIEEKQKMAAKSN